MFKAIFFILLTFITTRYLTLNEVQEMCDKYERYRFNGQFYTCFRDQPLEKDGAGEKDEEVKK